MEVQNEKYTRDYYLGHQLWLNRPTIRWVFSHIDCFVSQGRHNTSLEKVTFSPYAVDGQGDEFWDKVAQAIGNLQGLKMLVIELALPALANQRTIAFI
jgi:hypothetical protein